MALNGLSERSPELVSRFWTKVKRSASDHCWLWTASRVKGYGQFVLPRLADGRQPHIYAHRFAWIVSNGEIPEGLSVLHRCDTPLCVNPAHLFLGTQQVNLTDARQKGRLREWMPRAPLTVDSYREILTSGARGIDLAQRFGVSPVSVSRIRNGQQGARIAALILAELAGERILQGESRLSELRHAGHHAVHQVLEPVPFRQLPVVGEVR